MPGVCKIEPVMASSTVTTPTPLAALQATADELWPCYLLFFISGFPALIYQIVWERSLFTIYGVNIESVTVIVTVFMLGLGLGSLAGGALSALPRVPLLGLFGLIEVCIGIFGANSLRIFHGVASFTVGGSTARTGFVSFLLLIIPTLLMGSTLPLLVKHLVRRTANVGESVGSLYAVNTLGSGVACLMAALFIMRVLGEAGAVRLAASLNVLVGLTALLWQRSKNSGTIVAAAAQPAEPGGEHLKISFGIGMLLAGLGGFVALAYEIIWFRIYSFASGGSAFCFADLLGFYLFGIAYGSYAVHDMCKRKLKNDLARTLRVGATVVLLGTFAGFLLGPVVSLVVPHMSWTASMVMVAVVAALLGAIFPMVSHAAIGPTEEAGKKLSYLYLSNIVGSALGSFAVGFVILDHWSTRTTSLMLLGPGFGMAVLLVWLAGPSQSKSVLAWGVAGTVVLALGSSWLYSGFYYRLLFKSDTANANPLVNVVENRSGVIAVDSRETVYGGGAYDGHFNIAATPDTNGIFRAYAIPALHPDPQQVLMIGLSSGSWAQIVANDPQVRDLTIVEINPGYLPLIRERHEVSSLLTNPKVHIVIDDGRRWLVSHPDRKFDMIVMNTTFFWRSNVSNLLSVEFLQLVRQHLKPGGVEYYNTTRSPTVQFTGISVFPYALRVSSFLALSDSPIVYDRTHLRAILESYRIDGEPVFDLSKAADRARLEATVSLPEVQDEKPGPLDETIETRASMLARQTGLRRITDNNMGLEWQ